MLEVGYCKDCKWWDDFCQERGECGLAIQGDAKLEIGFFGESASLYTDPDFGCTEWEAKE